MNMKMPYSALLVLFLSLTFFTPSTLAGLRFPQKASVVPPSCSDGSCGMRWKALYYKPPTYKPPSSCCPKILRQPPPYKPPPLYRSTSKGKP
ncbi:hypothetical protein JHK87_027917 [Glycine soja]|nr:hypothetical protein JHK87_027917 [Glycine soja]